MLKILSVEKNSIAEKSGINVGDVIVSINKKKVSDIIDYNYLISDEEILFELKRDSKKIEIKIKRNGINPVGITVEHLKIRRCLNNCIFCFVDQLPKDARKSLFIKDDDYRASFLYGNFISLSNLNENDFKRIKKLGLSPLYISVHTTNPTLRSKIMGNEECARIKEMIERLISCNVKIHTQIVLIPDINDGDEYLSTLEDLASYYPHILSIGVVPVGLTSYRQNLKKIKNKTPEWAKKVVEITLPYQNEFRKKFGLNFVYLADEFYISADYEIPEAEYYDDFPQLENGIGIVRKFLDGLKKITIPDFYGKTLLVTGRLASKYIYMLEQKFKEKGLEAETVVVKNRYFGDDVTVAGLLGGWDILSMLYEKKGENVLLPPDILNDDDLFIDNLSLEKFKSILNKNVYIAPREMSDFYNILK